MGFDNFWGRLWEGMKHWGHLPKDKAGCMNFACYNFEEYRCETVYYTNCGAYYQTLKVEGFENPGCGIDDAPAPGDCDFFKPLIFWSGFTFIVVFFIWTCYQDVEDWRYKRARTKRRKLRKAQREEEETNNIIAKKERD